LIQYNTINNAGYHGFQFIGSPITIQNNFINNFCLLKDDGGGIYTYSNTSAGVKTIQNNIILNAIGAPNGTSSGILGGGALGIYADGASNNIQILNNSVANCQQLGIDINDGQNDVISGNTVYNCGTPYQGGDGGGGQIAITHWSGGQGVRNVTLTNNIFCAELAAGQRTISASTPDNDLTLFFGTADYNYYARPMNDATSIVVRTTGPALLTLAQWQTAIGGKDLHSKTSPKTITSTSSLRFEYNASTSSKTVTLGAAYIDIKGTSYPSSITLAPYSSAVLILASATEAKASTNTTEVSSINNPVSQSLVVYPNPVGDNFTLGVNNTYTGRMNIQILNEAGALIQAYSFEKNQPNMQVTLPSKALASGFYFVHVQVGDNWSDVKRILKE
jgi:parallel beta-helix repeat protein